MTRFTRAFLFTGALLGLLFPGGAALAVVNTVTVAPASSPAALTLNVVVPPFNIAPSLDITAQLQGKTVGDFVSTPLPSATPPSASLTWKTACRFTGVGPVSPVSARSTSGVLTTSGATVQTLGLLNIPVCPSGGTATAPESVPLTGAVATFIAADLLSTPIVQFLQTQAVKKTFTFTYTRTWFDVASQPTPPPSASATIVVSATMTTSLANNAAELTSASGALISSNAPLITVPLTPAGAVNAQIQWSTVVTVAGLGAPLTVRSNSLTIRDAHGQVVQTLAKPLTVSPFARAASLLPAPVPQTSTFPVETISSAPAFQALVRGVQRGVTPTLIFERSFTDGTKTVTARVNATFPIAGPNAGPLRITQISLYYEDGSRVRVFPEGEPVTVMVELNYAGLAASNLIGRCEVARSVPGGALFFRTVRLINQPLLEPQRTILRCPTGPLQGPGTYFFRFLVQQPELAFAPPVIRFGIGTSAAGRVEVIGPPLGASISRNLAFAWKPLVGGGPVDGYRVEIYDRAEVLGGLVTGLEVPGHQSAARISELVLGHLTSGETYWWRVVAIDGTPVAESALRRIVMP